MTDLKIYISQEALESQSVAGLPEVCQASEGWVRRLKERLMKDYEKVHLVFGSNVTYSFYVEDDIYGVIDFYQSSMECGRRESWSARMHLGDVALDIEAVCSDHQVVEVSVELIRDTHPKIFKVAHQNYFQALNLVVSSILQASYGRPM